MFLHKNTERDLIKYIKATTYDIFLCVKVWKSYGKAVHKSCQPRGQVGHGLPGCSWDMI